MSEHDDRWMQKWAKLLAAGAGRGGGVLELGCDNGRDTDWLVQQEYRVVAADISIDALRQCAHAVPAANVVQLDLSRPLPFADGSFGAVVASLCLHYFPWETTLAAMAEIHRCLKPFGILLCRVNSTRDLLHGARSGGRELERHFYEVNGTYARYKRFFDRNDVQALFEGDWKVLQCAERTIHRYEKPKVAWEIVARR
jgi:SAM-dependent methyltransferase